MPIACVSPATVCLRLGNNLCVPSTANALSFAPIMKPTQELATTRTPEGNEVTLCQHDRDYTIRVNRQELMNTRQHESELELARLGCAHLTTRKAPSVLIGGLGLGYTLRQTLDMVAHGAEIVVAELLKDIVEWNRNQLAELNGNCLNDKRVRVNVGDVLGIIASSQKSFDAILLDIDNGPSAMTESANNNLYTKKGIEACRRALRERGCLAVWSADACKQYEERLVRCGFHVRRFRVPAYKGSKSQGRFVWVASENKGVLPPGGGEPHLPKRRAPQSGRRPFRHKRR
jgi:spermidine synthase